MRRWAKVTAGVLTIGVAVPLLFIGTLYLSAWYFRWRAEELLAYGKTIQPGVTKEADLLRDLKSLQKHVSYARYDSSLQPDLAKANGIPRRSSISDEYFLYNSPAWLGSVFAHTPAWGRTFISRYMSLDEVVFSVRAESQEGLVTRLGISELSWRPPGGHANASDVVIYSYRDSLDEARVRHEAFNGYRVDRQMIPDAMGRQLPNGVLFSQYVLIDDRGTAEQRRKALDFHLQCFTSWFGCRDVAKMLQPEPNR